MPRASMIASHEVVWGGTSQAWTGQLYELFRLTQHYCDYCTDINAGLFVEVIEPNVGSSWAYRGLIAGLPQGNRGPRYLTTARSGPGERA